MQTKIISLKVGYIDDVKRIEYDDFKIKIKITNLDSIHRVLNYFIPDVEGFRKSFNKIYNNIADYASEDVLKKQIILDFEDLLEIHDNKLIKRFETFIQFEEKYKDFFENSPSKIKTKYMKLYKNRIC